MAPPLHAQGSRRVSGRVLSAADSAPLASVLVRTVGSPGSVLSDSAGAFVIEGPVTPFRIAIRRIGLVPDTASVPAGVDTVTLYARALPVLLSPLGVEAVASPARARFDTLAQPNLVTLSGADIMRTPGLLEPDVLRAVQLLPGTVSRNDYSTGYNVRGGESDQNLVLLDGITVFNPSHLGGIFSTFDVNAIDRADFMNGGFPAEYSGRLSSVLDVSLRAGSGERAHASGGISLLSSKALLEAPVGPVSLLLSARRTYIDQLVKTVSKEVLPYYFTDLMGKVSYPYRGGGVLSLTTYWGRDVFSPNLVKAVEGREAIDLTFDWGNRLAGLNWSQPVGRGMLEQHASVSEFFTRLDLKPDLVHFGNTARLLSGRTAYAFPRLGGHAAKLGVAVEHFDMAYQITNPGSAEGAILDEDQSSSEGSAGFFNRAYRPTVLSAFLQDQWTVTPSLILRGGVRAERVGNASFSGLSPRGSFKLFVSPDHAITGSAGRYHQMVQSQRDQELPISIYEFWVGASSTVPVARSDHLVLGYEGWIGGGTQVTVEGYRKTFDNLITPNRGLALRDSGETFLPVTGDAWGVDVLVRRHIGALRGWIAYGFTHARRHTQDVDFPPAHDRRHTLNVVLQAPGPLHSEMGLRWGLGSPLPYTPLLGEWDHRSYSPTYHAFLGSHNEPLGGDINSARFPNYSRLDAGLRWHSRKWGLVWEPYMQIVNVYNRRNVFTYFFDNDRTPAGRTAIYQLPILFTLGLDFSW